MEFSLLLSTPENPCNRYQCYLGVWGVVNLLEGYARTIRRKIPGYQTAYERRRHYPDWNDAHSLLSGLFS